MKSSAILCPNYFRYVWKSSAILRSINLNYIEIFRNLPFNLPRYTLKPSAILRSIPKPMALNLLLTFSIQFSKAVLRSSAIFRSSSLRYCLKSSAILRPNYFRYVWKSSAILHSIYLIYVEIFRNLPFCLPRYTLISSVMLHLISQNYGIKSSVNIFRLIYQSCLEIFRNLLFKFPEVLFEIFRNPPFKLL